MAGRKNPAIRIGHTQPPLSERIEEALARQRSRQAEPHLRDGARDNTKGSDCDL